MAELEARCRRLRDELDAADAARERALRALQVEHLRLKSGMEKRVAAAEAAEATAKKRAATAARLERETRELRGALERRTTKANAERKRADAAERRLRERGGDVVDDAKTERRGGDAETDAEQRPADDSDADGDASGDENADANRNDGEYRRGGTNAHETATPPEGHPAITPFDPRGFGRHLTETSISRIRAEEREERDGFGGCGETARRSGEVNFDDVKNADVDAEVSAGYKHPARPSPLRHARAHLSRCTRRLRRRRRRRNFRRRRRRRFRNLRTRNPSRRDFVGSKIVRRRGIRTGAPSSTRCKRRTPRTPPGFADSARARWRERRTCRFDTFARNSTGSSPPCTSSLCETPRRAATTARRRRQQSSPRGERK